MIVLSRGAAPASCVLLALALLMAGCMIGPDYHRPPTEVRARWLESGSPQVDQREQVGRAWWRVFNDPVLSRLVTTAYQRNLTLRAAGARVLEARAELGVAIGELYPQQQTLSAAVDYTRLPISAPYKLYNSEFWHDTFEIQTGWELDLWGKLRRAIESADYGYLASIADYDDVLVTLTADVASTYVQVRTLQKQIEIARANVRLQEQSLRIAEFRYEGGVVTKRDVDEAENVLGNTAAAVPALKIQLQQSKNALTVLLGMTPGSLDKMLAADYARIPTAPEQVATGIPADLLRRRPDLRRDELQAAAQCAQIGVAKADLLPAFSLLGTLGTVGSNVAGSNLDSVFSSRTIIWSAGPTISWNVLNYGRIINNVRLQDARFQELLINYQNAVLNAQREVENGLAAFIDSRQRVAFLTRAAAAAADAVTIANTQYNEGTVDFTMVLIAEQNLFRTENSLAVASGAVPLGLIASYRALGGGWQIREGHNFIREETREEMARRTAWGSLLKPQAPGLPGPEDRGRLVRPPEF